MNHLRLRSIDNEVLSLSIQCNRLSMFCIASGLSGMPLLPCNVEPSYTTSTGRIVSHQSQIISIQHVRHRGTSCACDSALNTLCNLINVIYNS